MVLRVASVNILNDRSRWSERRPLLVRELAERSLDLIALQEVANPLGESTAHQIASDLGGYAVHVAPKSGWGRRFEGIAILSRLPIERHWILDLKGQQRTAQFVRVQVGERPILFANGHFYWWPSAHSARLRQIKLVQEWLQENAPEIPAIVCGDFNATPDSLPIAWMRKTFRSAYATRHGAEPDSTCPTPLVGRNRAAELIKKAAMKLFTNRPGESWRGTLDYIFTTPNIYIIDCETFLDRPAEHDPTLYPSDHLGLEATLDIPE